MTLLELLDRTTIFFEGKKIPSPRLQSEELTAHVLKKPRLSLYLEFDRPMSSEELDELRPLVKRRSHGEPLQYILGSTEFCGLEIRCSPSALIPRPETELLAEIVTDQLSSVEPGRLVDVGTGSGCLALACAAGLPNWEVLGVEKSETALELAKMNTARYSDLGVQVVSGDLTIELSPPPKAVVANLPYLTSKEMQDLQKEVTFEPSLALDGGRDGLDLIRKLVNNLPPETQFCFLEIGIDHGTPVTTLLKEAGFKTTSIQNDLTERPRFAIGTK